MRDTSFTDIAVSYERWVLFAMLIIVNQKNFWQAGLKTLMFFVISQTLVFLVEWPFEGVFYFPYWYRWMSVALLTLPFGAQKISEYRPVRGFDGRRKHSVFVVF